MTLWDTCAAPPSQAVRAKTSVGPEAVRRDGLLTCSVGRTEGVDASPRHLSSSGWRRSWDGDCKVSGGTRTVGVQQVRLPSTPVSHPCQRSEVDISLPDAVMETKRWGNRRGPEEGWGWEWRHSLAHPVARSH